MAYGALKVVMILLLNLTDFCFQQLLVLRGFWVRMCLPPAPGCL